MMSCEGVILEGVVAGVILEAKCKRKRLSERFLASSEDIIPPLVLSLAF